MSLTLTNIRSTIETGFASNWQDLTYIIPDNSSHAYDGTKISDILSNGLPFIELQINGIEKKIVSLNRFQRNSGTIKVIFYVPLDSGTLFLNQMINRALFCLRGYNYSNLSFYNIVFRKGKLGYGLEDEQEEQYHVESLNAEFKENIPHADGLELQESTLFSDLRRDVESYFATAWTYTDIKYDNIKFNPENTPWVSLEIIENFQKRVDSENDYRLFGIINLNVYVRLKTGTNTVLNYCENITNIFTNDQINSIVFSDGVVTRIGEVEEWLQYNVSCDFYKDQIYSTMADYLVTDDGSKLITDDGKYLKVA